MLWNGQSPDRNSTEMMWKALKQEVHERKQSNIPELKLVCKEEGANIPPS